MIGCMEPLSQVATDAAAHCCREVPPPRAGGLEGQVASIRVPGAIVTQHSVSETEGKVGAALRGRRLRL
jgi:hypothetical protein